MAQNADYDVTYGSIPTIPLKGWFLDGNFQKTTGAGITSVTVTVWPATGPRARQRVPGAAPIITAGVGSYSTDGAGFTEYSYAPTAADCLHPPGWYVAQWTVNSTGGHVDIWPNNEQLITWYIATATS